MTIPMFDGLVFDAYAYSLYYKLNIPFIINQYHHQKIFNFISIFWTLLLPCPEYTWKCLISAFKL